MKSRPNKYRPPNTRSGITASLDVTPNGGTDLAMFDITGGAADESYSVFATSPPSGALLGGNTFSSVPEPATSVLLGAATLGLLTIRRRKH